MLAHWFAICSPAVCFDHWLRPDSAIGSTHLDVHARHPQPPLAKGFPHAVRALEPIWHLMMAFASLPRDGAECPRAKGCSRCMFSISDRQVPRVHAYSLNRSSLGASDSHPPQLSNGFRQDDGTPRDEASRTSWTCN